MANIAVFASGNGSNFESLVKEFQNDSSNIIKLLICNRKEAFVLERAKNLGINYELVNYVKDGTEEVEKQIAELIKKNQIDIIFLAGFMKILSPSFIQSIKIPIVNIHPSILPKYKGTHSIERAYQSKDKEIGISIHFVNEEVDGGEIILQKKIPLDRKSGLQQTEKEVHDLEHIYYPTVARNICERINISRQ